MGKAPVTRNPRVSTFHRREEHESGRHPGKCERRCFLLRIAVNSHGLTWNLDFKTNRSLASWFATYFLHDKNLNLPRN